MMNNHEFLKLEPEEILDEARYGKPLIIVEGEYDYIYEYLCDDINSNHYEIIPIEDLIGAKGNLALEKTLLAIEKFAQVEELEYTPHLLGIIDRDYREYENRLTKSNILLILELYSIESYFINQEILYRTLEFCIRSKRLMDDSFVNSFYMKIIDSLTDNLYLDSIDKLKRHLEIENVIEKYKFIKSFETLLKITKGKDLLTRFLVEIQNILSSQSLYKMCQEESIKPCNKHRSNKHKIFCLYITQKYDIHQLKKYVFEQPDILSLSPTRQRLQQLK